MSKNHRHGILENEAVKRNERRFPSDFIFRLTKQEKRNWSQTFPQMIKLKNNPCVIRDSRIE